MANLDEIEDFLILAQTRSFTKAADARNVSQPAFTRRIQQLEAQMAVPLFDRSTTPISLTNAGERFLDYAQNLSKTFRQAMIESRAAWSKLGNPVRFATTHTLAITLFPALWKTCLRKRADLKVTLTGQRTERCLSDLADKSADIALVHATNKEKKELDKSNFEILSLRADELVAVQAPHVKDNACKFLGYSPETVFSGVTTPFIQDKKKIDEVFESPSSEVLKAMALAGHGIAYLPASLIEDECKDGYLVPSSHKLAPIGLNILILRLKGCKNEDVQLIWDVARSGSGF